MVKILAYIPLNMCLIEYNLIIKNLNRSIIFHIIQYNISNDRQIYKQTLQIN